MTDEDTSIAAYDAPRRLSDQIAEHLRGEIYSGRLLPGQRLREVELCARLSVARATLREALLALQRDQLVVVRPHRGASVVELTEEDIREIFMLRRHLEPLAARYAAERRTDADLDMIRESLSEMEISMNRNDPFRRALHHAEFHRAIARAARLPRLESSIDALCTQMLVSHGVGAQVVRADTQVAHAAIAAAIAARSANAAEAAMRDHFSPVEPVIDAYRDVVVRRAAVVRDVASDHR